MENIVITEIISIIRLINDTDYWFIFKWKFSEFKKIFSSSTVLSVIYFRSKKEKRRDRSRDKDEKKKKHRDRDREEKSSKETKVVRNYDEEEKQIEEDLSSGDDDDRPSGPPRPADDTNLQSVDMDMSD